MINIIRIYHQHIYILSTYIISTLTYHPYIWYSNEDHNENDNGANYDNGDNEDEHDVDDKKDGNDDHNGNDHDNDDDTDGMEQYVVLQTTPL